MTRAPARALTHAAMKIERYSTVHHLPHDYTASFENAADPNLFLALFWFKNFERTVLANQATPAIYGLRAPLACDRLVATLVLMRSVRRELGLSIRALTSMANFYTSYFGIVSDADTNLENAAQQFTRAIYDDRHTWD